MTYTFKVGDRGKTRGGWNYPKMDYTINAIGASHMLVGIGSLEYTYSLDGTIANKEFRLAWDLLPPKRRIQGWVNIYFWREYSTSSCCGREVFSTRQAADNVPNAIDRIACIYIDTEEGDGLD